LIAICSRTMIERDRAPIDEAEPPLTQRSS
jgi:hypothetical protein